MKNVIVVGGGTAGWLTALFINKTFPDLKVTLIESKEIGILGAGEGSTPHLINFLDILNIPVSDLITHCDATIKNGIKFTNWNNDNSFYYHPFQVNKTIPISTEYFFSHEVNTDPLMVSSIYLNGNPKSIDFIEKVSEINKVPFIYNTRKESNKILDYHALSFFSIHFNATKLANRLKQIGIDRGINVIEKTISDVVLNDIQYIESFTFDDNTKIDCDFVFDCSGFHRLIIGKTFKSNWKSYKEFLPVDSAVPFFIKMDEDIPPYTEAIAMKYGWIWKIPLQTRYGCGYVYDSSLVSEENIVKEIEEYLGFEPEYPRKNKGSFKFSAGGYEEPWINNCVAIGLSSNFIEPLEATSIWVSISSLKKILTGVEWIYANNQKIRDDFNKHVNDMNSEIVNFIYFHYMSNRKDTKFWEKFTYNNAPDSLKNKLDIWKFRFPNIFETNNAWGSTGWLIIGSNIKVLNNKLASLYIKNSVHYKNILDQYENLINIQENFKTQCSDHRNFLEYLNEI